MQRRYSPNPLPMLHECTRFMLFNFVDSPSLRVLELGVAEGEFCKEILSSHPRICEYYGVDSYKYEFGSQHYQKLQSDLKTDSRAKIIQCDFDDALNLFPDGYFDVIYLDGFAHDGHCGGETAKRWLKKLRKNGLLAGDDYHEEWPLITWYVNEISDQLSLPVNVLTTTRQTKYSEYPTWFFQVPEPNKALSFPVLLRILSQFESVRLGLRRHPITRRLIKLKNKLKNGAIT